jgi:hypothetical protein
MTGVIERLWRENPSILRCEIHLAKDSQTCAGSTNDTA